MGPAAASWRVIWSNEPGFRPEHAAAGAASSGRPVILSRYYPDAPGLQPVLQEVGHSLQTVFNAETLLEPALNFIKAPHVARLQLVAELFEDFLIDPDARIIRGAFQKRGDTLIVIQLEPSVDASFGTSHLRSHIAQGHRRFLLQQPEHSELGRLGLAVILRLKSLDRLKRLINVFSSPSGHNGHDFVLLGGATFVRECLRSGYRPTMTMPVPIIRLSMRSRFS